MSTATVAQFSKHPARFLDAVERGETLMLIRNGKPVARILPDKTNHRRKGKSASEKAEEWLAQEKEFFESMSGPVHGESAVRTLQEERR